MSFDMKRELLPNGVALPYIEQGDRDGLPVIFIHGITDSHRSYEPILAALPTKFHAFALTMRGHGDASKHAEDYSPEAMAGDVALFLDAHKINQAVIVGHSMGSVVARAFAHANPKRVLGLVLIGAFASPHGNPAVHELGGVIAGFGETIPYEFAREFQVSTLAQPVPDDYLAMVINETQKTPANVFRAAFHGLVERDRTFTGSGGQFPALIMWGDQDAFCPRADQDVLSSAFKNSRLLIYPGAGHALHWEMPVRFATDLSNWLNQIRVAHKDAA